MPAVGFQLSAFSFQQSAFSYGNYTKQVIVSNGHTGFHRATNTRTIVAFG
jgi:hypothetical protein